jgi:dihydroxyacetone kinase-like protein
VAETITAEAVTAAMQRAAAVLDEQSDYLTSLDQALGDGDMGITMAKIAKALGAYAQEEPTDDLGQFLAKAGMTANRAGSSTMGTLIATALMRAGKEIKGQDTLSSADLVTMFNAAAQGMLERGKAKLGDKTILDAIFPAANAFERAVGDGAPLADAGQAAVDAAAAGRDSVTAERSKIGRASWQGERSEGKLDAGCAMFVLVLDGIVNG